MSDVQAHGAGDARRGHGRQAVTPSAPTTRQMVCCCRVHVDFFLARRPRWWRVVGVGHGAYHRGAGIGGASVACPGCPEHGLGGQR